MSEQVLWRDRWIEDYDGKWRCTHGRRVVNEAPGVSEGWDVPDDPIARLISDPRPCLDVTYDPEGDYSGHKSWRMLTETYPWFRADEPERDDDD